MSARLSERATRSVRRHPAAGERPQATGIRRYELIEGEIVTGRVERLPAAGIDQLFLERSAGDVLVLAAAARTGHAVLERELARHQVRVGHRVAIIYTGKVRTVDGARTYRDYQLEVLRP
ncbi:MAG: hypothetical protein DLM64_04860 [Solirubrobacterales bacterium]|nr:MAG: hypothetical protein DLM64_04860 [Solirubrobacterales bacterium]